MTELGSLVARRSAVLDPDAVVGASRLRGATFLTVVALTLGACSGAHLYDKERHALAQAAESDLKALSLSKALTPQRQRMADLLTAELDARRHHALARRDADVIRALSRPVSDAEGLGPMVQRRLTELAARTDPSTLLGAMANLKKLEARTESYGAAIGLAGSSMDPRVSAPKGCAPLAERPPAPVDEAYDHLRKACDDLAKERQKLSGAGAIGKTFAEMADLHGVQELLANHRKEKIAELKKALEGAEGGSSKSVTEQLDKIREKAQDLEDVPQEAKDVLKRLGLEGLALSPVIDVLDERRAKLVNVLSGFLDAGTDKEPAADASKDARLAFALGKVYAATVNESPTVGLSVIALQNQRLQNDILSTKRKLQRAEELAALLEERKDAVIAEYRLLVEAKVAADTVPADAVLARAFESGDEAARQGVFKALNAYAASMTIGLSTFQEIETRRVGLLHGQILDSSEDALVEWETLLKIPTAQLAALLGSGIKPAEFAQLILSAANVAGLFTIAGAVK
ncbi:MAG: hypothetical protein ABIT01_10030 [Thermoanaerobaculia bacterium]